IRDPELDRLVRELNRSNSLPGEEAGRATSPAEPLLDLPLRTQVSEGEPLDELLVEMVRQRASDLLLVAGLPPVFRIDGRLVRLQADPLDGDAIAALFQPHLGGRFR